MRGLNLRRTAVLCLLLAILYVVLARAGLTLATVGRSVTLVWPPTGLALAILFLQGRHLWPGILLGALFVNATTPGVPFESAAGMAAGNTLEALVGALLLRRWSLNPALRRQKDVLKLLVIACTLSTAISATIGPLSLWAGGVIGAGSLADAARVWWIGDFMGALIVAPLLLVWLSPDADRGTSRSILEATILLALLVALTALVFRHHLIFVFAAQPYVIFPLIIWAALRFGPRGAVSANFIVSAISILAFTGTDRSLGHSPSDSLVILHTFMAVVALTSLMLGATAAERADALSAREDFISIASHELRTPLTALQLQIQRMRRLMDKDGEAAPSALRLPAWLSLVERQVARMSGLAEVLLDLTRLRTGELTLQAEDTDLATVVREAVENLRAAEASAKAPFLVQAAAPVTGTWDRLRMQQVVINLLENALKYGAGRPIFICVEGDADTATVEVRDEGPGIPQEDQERIFRRFERRRIDRALPGLGLGLHIAREIVEAHQGRIRVHSQPGAGASFTVTLPRRPSRRRRAKRLSGGSST